MSIDRSEWPPVSLDPRPRTAGDRSISGADRAIRVSTAVAVIAVAGIAAYVSYWHAYEVVRAHGEVGVTARLEPATIDGLVYSSSMVVLYAARHQLPVPSLARWLLALGIIATLAANIAHGLSHGPVGAAVAAWPAASLVGSYELLLWLIRTAGTAERGPTVDHIDELRHRVLDPQITDTVRSSDGWEPMVATANGSMNGVAGRVAGSKRAGLADAGGRTGASGSGPDDLADGQLDADKVVAAWAMQAKEEVGPDCRDEKNVEKAAAAAYQVSVDQGKPLSERRLAAMFGRTSRRWARHRMAEARSFDSEHALLGNR